MKKIILIFLSILILSTINAQNTNLEWVKSSEGYQGSAKTKYIEKDSLGNIYSIGHFSGSVDFNPSITQASFLTSNSNSSWYIQKLDNNGEFVWVRALEFESGGIASFEIDNYDRLHLMGEFKDTVDCDPSYQVNNIISNGNYDVFVMTLSSEGNFIWAKSFGGIGDDRGADITVDKFGNTYTHGYFEGAVDFDPGPAIYYHSSEVNDAESGFVHKLDYNGNFVWVKAFTTANSISGYCSPISIDLDSKGNIYCGGYFWGLIDFDPGTGVQIPPSDSCDSYIVKLDSIGDFVWLSYIINTPGYSGATFQSMCLDKNNNVYSTGSFGSTVDFDPGPDTLYLDGKTYIQKLDENGRLLWVKSYGIIRCPSPWSITTDIFGNIYSFGRFSDSVDLEPGPNTLMINTNGPGAYLQKLNSDGDFLWAGGFTSNYGGAHGNDMIVDSARNIYAAGEWGGTVDFDLGPGIHNETATNATASSFVLKLSQCEILTTESIIACDSFIWRDSITYHQSTQSAYYTLQSSSACDSVICLSLNIPVIDTTISLSTDGASFIANQSNANYQWMDCNNSFALLPQDTSQIYTPIINGDYSVAINVSGCIDTSACINISNVSIEEIDGNTIKLYPNPNSGKFIIDLGSITAKSIRIQNSLGQEIFVKHNISSQYFNMELKPGIYFAQIRTEKASKTIKFVVR